MVNKSKTNTGKNNTPKRSSTGVPKKKVVLKGNYVAFKLSNDQQEKAVVRVEMRVTPSKYKIITKGMDLTGNTNQSQFIIEAAIEKAQQIINKEELILQSEADREMFFNALLNPPKPNAAMIELMEEYKRKVKNDD